MFMNKLCVSTFHARTVLFGVALVVCGVAARGQEADVEEKLQGS
jgi:hypothetical protein